MTSGSYRTYIHTHTNTRTQVHARKYVHLQSQTHTKCMSSRRGQRQEISSDRADDHKFPWADEVYTLRERIQLVSFTSFSHTPYTAQHYRARL